MGSEPFTLHPHEVRAVLSGQQTRFLRPIEQLRDDRGRSFKFHRGRIWASMLPEELGPLDEEPPQSVFGGEVLFDGDRCFTPVVVGRGRDGEGSPLVPPLTLRGTVHVSNGMIEKVLRVIDITCCRLGEVTDDQAVECGFNGWYSPCHPDAGSTDGRTPFEELREQWNSDYGDKFPVESNPFVWNIKTEVA